MSEHPEKSLLLECFLRNRSQLRAYVRRTLPTPDGIDDVLQDAYLRIALSSAVTGVVLRDPLSYCARVVKNAALDHCRAHLREHAERQSLDDFDTMPDPRPMGQPDSSLHATQRKRRLQRRLDSLEPRLRQAFVMRYYHGASQREIAKALGCALGSVGAMIDAALTTLGIRPDPAPQTNFLDTRDLV